MRFQKRLILVLCVLLSTTFVFAQTKTVHGKVIDSSNNPITNASVTLKGSRKGVTTDNNGVFKLEAPLSAEKIVISSIGYITQEADITSSTEILVSLKPLSGTLSEVVVVAYGTQKKSSLTAAVSSVSGTQLVNAPVADLSNAVGGRLPGLIVKQGSGEPGYDNADIKIRGVSTIGNSNALVIVDGIERPMSNIDPHDVETFTILKDAASVAPYGLRGANGVILITTKRGNNSGRFSLTYDGRYSWSKVTRQPKELSGYDWAVMKNAGAVNDGVAVPYSDDALKKLKDGSDPDHFANESVAKDLFKTAKMNEHNLSLIGGTKNVSVYSSLGYLNQGAIWGNVTNYKRYNFRTNVDVTISDNTKFGVDVSLSNRDAQYPGAGNAGYIIYGFWRLNPTNPIYYSNGKPVGYFERNPYLDLYESGYTRENNYYQNLTLRFEQKIPFINGLTFKANFGVDKNDFQSKRWRKPYTFYTIQQDGSFKSGTGNVPKPILSNTYDFYRQLTTQLLLTYDHSWGKHTVNALGVFEPRITTTSDLAAQRTNYALDIDELNTGSADPSDISNGGTSTKATQVGYAYRVGYNYATKYFIEAAGRYDGHYYFAPNSRYAFFPSFSAAWRLSEESFLKNNKIINNLKIRGSWGKSGNLAGSAYQYLRQYNYNGGAVFLFNGTAVPSVSEAVEPNPYITWEKAIKSDIGIDLGMWNGLLNIEADVFYEKRKDMLNAATSIVPVEYGIGLAQENSSSMVNRGIDFQISSRHSFTKDLSFDLGFNFTYAVNKIIDIQEAETIKNNPNRSRTGKAYGTQFGYDALGFFQSAEEIANTPYAADLGYVKPGDIKYRDVDNNGILDANDIVPIGKPIYPEMIYGLTVHGKYKNFQIDMLWQGAAKVNYYLTGWASRPFTQSNGVAFEFQKDYWTPENPNAEFPRILSNSDGYPYNNYASSLWIRDGSYVRLKTLTLSYDLDNFPPSIGLKGLRIYVSGQNLITITKTKYIDPEALSTTDYYPQVKTYALGVNLNF